MSFLVSVLSAQASLKDNMEVIGNTFQILGKQFRDPSKNADSAQQAAKLNGLFTASLNEVPSTIAHLPEEQKAEALAHYTTLMQQEVDLTVELQKAFEANDNAGAKVILMKMLDIQKQGHGAFKPPQ